MGLAGCGAVFVPGAWGLANVSTVPWVVIDLGHGTKAHAAVS